jgi:hypothetical protein
MPEVTRLLEKVLVNLDNVIGLLDLDADAILNHQARETLTVNKHNTRKAE